MGEMVERVGDAIRAEFDKLGSDYHPSIYGCQQLARAAIEALREPTESMCDAAGADILSASFDNVREDVMARCIFIAMIDAALAGEWAHLADLDKDEVPAAIDAALRDDA